MATKLEYCVYIYNVFLFIAGLGCLGVGIWMYADKDVHSYFVMLRRSPEDNTLLAAAGLFIATGLIIIGVGILGCFGAMRKNTTFLGLYVAALVLILILELTAGFIVVVFKDEIHMYVKKGMKEQLTDYYTWDNEVGHAWNRVQVRTACCGVDGSWDYYEPLSNWWVSQNDGDVVTAYTVNVPDSCCVLEMNQERDRSRVDPQNPQPKDRRRCNEDAAGRKDGSSNLRGLGCYASLLDFIYVHINLIIGLGLAAGLLQIIGVVFGILLLMSLRNK